MPTPGVCLGMIVWAVWLALAGPAPAAVVAAQVNLESLTKEGNGATADLGDGVTVQISGEQGLLEQNLAVLDQGQKVQDLEYSRYYEAVRLEAGPARYWVVSAYTGGAHCCGVYYLFSRPADGQPLRYLGATPAHDDVPLKLKGLVRVRQGQIFFSSFDNRFDYFHEGHAGSMLVNTPRTFYLLRPDSLQLANASFKDFYLKAAAASDAEIKKEAGNRRRKPPAILASRYSPELSCLHFSDSLGQLLVKRTVLYLYAREDARAWQSLKAGVKKYYRSGRCLPELQRDIQEKMAVRPY